MFPYVQLFTETKKPFFCAEPWMAFPNAINAVSGARWLQPGKSDKAILTLSVE
jgi:galactose mutarotase-like enzyme